MLWPGTARARFLPAILPGLSGAEFAARLEQTIEAESTRLIGGGGGRRDRSAADAGVRGSSWRIAYQSWRQLRLDHYMLTT